MADDLSIRELNLGERGLRCLANDFECRVLEYLWERGEAPVKEIHEKVGRKHGLAHTSVGVYLDRMHGKGLVSRRVLEGSGGLKYLYQPRHSTRELGERVAARAARALREAFGGWAASSFAESLKSERRKND
jgi:predicted transcriptional regulator